MKINLVILEPNQNYINRLLSVFTARYADKFTLYSFTNQEAAMEILQKTKIDVFIADEAFEIDMERVPKRCGFAYFTNSSGVDSLYDQRAICKYQKAELIYKQILSLYSENAGHISGLKFHDDSSKVLVFSSPCGGTGTSTVAAACAKYFAKRGKKTLYLNFERFGSSEIVFSGEGQFGLYEIIYALKGKRANLSLKLESCVKQDTSGVYFFASAPKALDMMELGCEEMIRLISELKLLGTYEYIVVDMDFGLDKDTLKFYEQASLLVMVSDGSLTANNKLRRAYQAIAIKEETGEISLLGKLALLYNKFSSKTSVKVDDLDIRNIGGIPPYVNGTTDRIVEELSSQHLFEKMQ